MFPLYFCIFFSIHFLPKLNCLFGCSVLSLYVYEIILFYFFSIFNVGAGTSVSLSLCEWSEQNVVVFFYNFHSPEFLHYPAQCKLYAYNTYTTLSVQALQKSICIQCAWMNWNILCVSIQKHNKHWLMSSYFFSFFLSLFVFNMKITLYFSRKRHHDWFPFQRNERNWIWKIMVQQRNTLCRCNHRAIYRSHALNMKTRMTMMCSCVEWARKRDE